MPSGRKASALNLQTPGLRGVCRRPLTKPESLCLVSQAGSAELPDCRGHRRRPWLGTSLQSQRRHAVIPIYLASVKSSRRGW